MNKQIKASLALALAFALVLVLGFTLISRAADPAEAKVHAESIGSSTPPKTVVVGGKGEVVVEPDIAYVQLGVATRESDATSASKANNEKMAKLFEVMIGMGVAEKDIKTVSFSIYPQYSYKEDEPKIYAYEAQNIVRVSIKEPSKMGEIVAAAVDAGGNTVQEISYDLKDKKEAYAQALAMAVSEAKAKAEAIATAAGISLNTVPYNISEASEVTYQMKNSFARNTQFAADATMAAGSGAVPLSNNQIVISASVSAEYGINE